MSEKIEDKDFLSVVVDGGDKTEIVAAHIEDGDRPPTFHFHLIGVRKHAAGFDEALPSAGDHQPSPVFQGPVGLREPECVVVQGASFNQPHVQDNMSISWLFCQMS